MKSSATKNQRKLPWWVELLFVQIGLPDKWLSYLLKSKNNLKTMLNNNKKTIYYSIYIISALILLIPVMKEASYKNICIKDTKDYLKIYGNNQSDKINKNRAVNYCNGGELIN